MTTSPTPSAEALLANHLALDVYHRDVIGGLIKFLDGKEDSIDAAAPLHEYSNMDLGFYAKTYQTADKVYLVYRGTDDGSLDVINNQQAVINTIKNGPEGTGLRDLYYGYPIVLGSLGNLEATKNGDTTNFDSQAINAIRIYKEVAANAGGKEIVVVGQSLGAGLAGFVGKLYHKETYVFNAAAYEAAAMNAWGQAATYMSGPDGQTMCQFIYGTDRPAVSFEDLVSSDKIHAFVVPGEVISVGVQALSFMARAVGDFAKLKNDMSQAEYDEYMMKLSGTRPYNYEIEYPDYDGTQFLDMAFSQAKALGVATRHTASTLNVLMFGESLDRKTWHDAATFIWPAWINDNIARGIGYKKYNVADADTPNDSIVPTNPLNEAYVMAVAIAYTGVDAVGPFGDKAIRALFDDLNDMGDVLGRSEAGFLRTHDSPSLWKSFISYFLTDDHRFFPNVADLVGNLIVQYSGALAFEGCCVDRVSFKDYTGNYVSVDIANGILGLGKNGSSLAVDLSKTLWSGVFNSFDDNKVNITPFLSDELKKLFYDTSTTGLSSISNRFLRWLVGDTKLTQDNLRHLAKMGWGASTADIFDRIAFGSSEEGGIITIADRSYDPTIFRGNSAQVTVFIGKDVGEDIMGTKSNDLIFGGLGHDKIDGGAGDDVIIAGPGSRSTTIGGMGRDVVINFSQGGVIYGDLVGLDPKTGAAPADIAENADVFWFSRGTTVMDPQRHDRILFQGISLTGGSVNPAYLASLGALPFGVGAFAAGQMLGATIAQAAGNAGLYFDKLIPFLTYKFEKKRVIGDNVVGTLHIGDIYDGLSNALLNIPGLLKGTDGSGLPVDLSGVMTIENFSFKSSVWGYQQFDLAERGSLGMAFKDANPIDTGLYQDSLIRTRGPNRAIRWT